MATGKTAFTWHSLYAWTDLGAGPSFGADPLNGLQPVAFGLCHPDTKRRAFEVIEASGLLKELNRVDPTPATADDVLKFHTPEYLAKVQEGSKSDLGFNVCKVTHFGKGGYEMGLLSLGGALSVLDTVLKGDAPNGYALINPPGHHAEPQSGMGFCTFVTLNGICAETALKNGCKRVAIVDYDVHHGNGAEKGFYNRKDVLTISIHQDGNYPRYSGYAKDRGEGEGLGYNLNIPLHAGCGNPAYEYAFDTLICPALMQYKPDIILVASGADASAMDPLGRQMVTSKGFKSILTKLKTVADAVCGGKLVCLQEGGYSPYYVPFVVHAMVETLAGVEKMKDAFAHLDDIPAANLFQPGQKESIDALVPFLKDIV
ncbi:hypothetical protein MNV49_005135 [Pseudohyphozyma bogoriensis]|nr:hypothetical protein MNV49_005135 [Pseudohyphozyma bogoriensis]